MFFAEKSGAPSRLSLGACAPKIYFGSEVYFSPRKAGLADSPGPDRVRSIAQNSANRMNHQCGGLDVTNDQALALQQRTSERTLFPRSSSASQRSVRASCLRHLKGHHAVDVQLGMREGQVVHGHVLVAVMAGISGIRVGWGRRHAVAAATSGFSAVDSSPGGCGVHPA